jgi:hypothetical protein
MVCDSVGNAMSKLIILLLLMIAHTVSAQTYILNDSATGRVWSNAVPAGWLVVDVGDRDLMRNEDLRDYRRAKHPTPAFYPSVVDTDLGIVVALTGTINRARQAIRDIDRARRPAKAALDAYLGDSKRKAKRKELRDAIENAATRSDDKKALKAMDEYLELVEEEKAEREALGIKKED